MAMSIRLNFLHRISLLKQLRLLKLRLVKEKKCFLQTLTQQVHQPDARRDAACLSLFSHIFYSSPFPCPNQRS